MFVTMFVFVRSIRPATLLDAADDGIRPARGVCGAFDLFPGLFPTRLRGTGVGFCYNTVRYLAAPAPTLMGYLATLMTFRSAACLMSTIYLVVCRARSGRPKPKASRFLKVSGGGIMDRRSFLAATEARLSRLPR
jgi:hypothetical protein